MDNNREIPTWVRNLRILIPEVRDEAKYNKKMYFICRNGDKIYYCLEKDVRAHEFDQIGTCAPSGTISYYGHFKDTNNLLAKIDEEERLMALWKGPKNVVLPKEEAVLENAAVRLPNYYYEEKVIITTVTHITGERLLSEIPDLIRWFGIIIINGGRYRAEQIRAINPSKDEWLCEAKPTSDTPPWFEKQSLTHYNNFVKKTGATASQFSICYPVTPNTSGRYYIYTGSPSSNWEKAGFTEDMQTAQSLVKRYTYVSAKANKDDFAGYIYIPGGEPEPKVDYDNCDHLYYYCYESVGGKLVLSDVDAKDLYSITVKQIKPSYKKVSNVGLKRGITTFTFTIVGAITQRSGNRVVTFEFQADPISERYKIVKKNQHDRSNLRLGNGLVKFVDLNMLADFSHIFLFHHRTKLDDWANQQIEKINPSDNNTFAQDYSEYSTLLPESHPIFNTNFDKEVFGVESKWEQRHDKGNETTNDDAYFDGTSSGSSSDDDIPF